MSEKKIYVLDTNIILDNPNCVKESFEENDIVIPLTVIEELDNQKKQQGDVGYAARQALRLIESLRKDCNIHEGVIRNELGSKLYIEMLEKEDIDKWKDVGYNIQKNDDLIILTALKVKDAHGDATVLISNDNSVRIKASLLDVPAQHYKEGTVKKETLEYKGFKNVELPIEFFGTVDGEGGFSAKRLPLRLELEAVEQYVDEEVFINEFLLLEPVKDDRIPKKVSKKLKAVYMYNGEKLVKKSLIQKDIYGGLTGKNLEQSVAIQLLREEHVKVVALSGISGSGKTITALATSLTKLLKDKDSDYEKIILLKPTVSVGDDIGFLPGGVEEKLSHYMGSYLDNFKTLKKMETLNTNATTFGYEELKEKDMLEVESISFLRGRSIQNSIILIDECQNLTQNVIKTILTRVGENCSVVLLGDEQQIDRPYLSKYNNGLSYVVERLRGQTFFGYVKFIHGVRSEVSRVSAELL